MNLDVGNHDNNSDKSDYIWSVIIYTCLCYFDNYVLWINSKDVKKAISENLVYKMQYLVKSKSITERKDNHTIVYNCDTAIYHKDLILINVLN